MGFLVAVRGRFDVWHGCAIIDLRATDIPTLLAQSVRGTGSGLGRSFFMKDESWFVH